MNPPDLSFFQPGSLTFFKKEVIKAASQGFPLMLNLEPTNACNLACVMCARRLARHPDAYLPLGIVESVLDEARRFGRIRWLTLHKDGEPLMHPEFAAMARLCAKSPAVELVHFNTNALLLDETMALALIDAGVDDITLSVDADCEETFRKVKGRPGLDIVRRNAERLIALRERLGADKPWVRAKIIDMPETAGEIDAFRQRWTGVADEVQVQKVHSYGGGLANEAPVGRYPCSLLWYSLAVNSDATVSLCCVDYRRQKILGDLRRESLHSIYTGQEFAACRAAHLSGDYAGLPSCARCECRRIGPDIGLEPDAPGPE